MQTQENYHTRSFQKLLATNHYTFELTLSKEVALIGVLFLLGALVRLSALQSNTLYVDEVIYVNAGRNYLAGDFSQNELSFMFGSYLFPITAALGEIPAGDISLRVLSISLNLVSAIVLYLLTRQLFGRPTALWAFILFTFSGISMSLAIQAVHDSLAVPFLITTLYFLATASVRHNRSVLYGVLAGLSFSIAVLAKFIVLGTLPPLLLLLTLFHLYLPGRLDKKFFQTALWFVGIVMLILTTYALRTSDVTLQAIAAYGEQEIAERLTILQRSWSEIGVIAILAVFGIILLIHRLYKTSTRQTRDRVLHGLLVAAIVVALLLLQIYHVVSSNARSLWQHNVMTLVLLAPFAGYALQRIADWFVTEDRLSNKPLRWLAYAAVIAVVIFLSQTSLYGFEVFQRSWPDVTNVVEHLRAEGFADTQPQDAERPELILAAAAPVYQYHLSPSETARPIWWTTWFFEYNGETGLDAMQAAANDCAFDLVILDNYFATDIFSPLEASLVSAGYENTFSDQQVLSYGAIIDINVYRPGVSAECSE